ncbi:MAG: TrmH family RNA methyltransferase [Robiginitalea sp.]|jgi:tRNA (guanosine-2'-O-)-methyltransferase
MGETANIDLNLLAHLEGFITLERKQRFLQVLASRTRYLTVALEDVYQLHNASAVIRSCDVFGIQAAHLIEGRFGNRLDKNIAMGAQRWVDIHRHASSGACIEDLRRKGYRIIATTPRQESDTLESFTLEGPTALFFGTEKEGLSPEVLREADGALHIPMYGFTESLNISVAAAIILQDLSTRLRQSDHPWRLSEAEILEKRFEWTRKTVRAADEIIARYYGTT